MVIDLILDLYQIISSIEAMSGETLEPVLCKFWELAPRIGFLSKESEQDWNVS